MQLSLLLTLLPLAQPASVPADTSLLAAVPDDAYVLVHCRDVAALRSRAEQNDWYRLLGSTHGEPFLRDLARSFRDETRTELDDLLAIAGALEGEVVVFDTGTVAGFVTEPPAGRAALTDLMREWLPRGDRAAERTFELAGGTVHLVAWPDASDEASGRAGHFAAFVDHPRALAIYSGDDSGTVLSGLIECVTGIGTDRRAALVSSYLEAGGGEGRGIELFVDFTSLVDEAEAELAQAVEGVLPDPSRLLGLEAGTWLHAEADVFPGTRVECDARLFLPPDTLASRLAATFGSLSHALPADLPKGAWALWALKWDVGLFYERARAAYEEAGLGEGLAMVDAGLAMAQGMAGVDPIADVLTGLTGDFAAYFVDPPVGGDEDLSSDMTALLSFGFHLGLVDGDAFRAPFERLIEVGSLDEVFALEQVAGVDAYVIDDEGGFDGGLALLPRALAAAPSRRVLERGLLALTRAADASLLDGSRMQSAIDGNAGACFLACVEMTFLRLFLMPELEHDLRLPPLDDGQPPRDPFDAQLVCTVRRTQEGFELRLETR